MHNRVILKRVAEETKTAGGLFIPTNSQEKPDQGIVVAVGPGRVTENGTLRPVDLKVGERVLFSKYGGTEVKFEGETHLILTDDEIYAVVE